MVEWWNSLSSVSQVFYCIAIPSTLILVIQTVLMFIGFGSEADGIDDVGDALSGDDIGDIDVDDAFDMETIGEAREAASGLDGLRIFTLKGIIAFFVVFGWVGIVMDSSGAALWLTIPIAFISGFAMMLLLALLLKAVLKLRNDGNTDNRNAIGVSGRVQLVIPPSRTGEGKVHVMLQGAYVERDAVTDEEESIPTGAEIVVVGVSGQTNLVVKRK